MALAHGVALPDEEPLLHYAHYMEALIWPVRRLKVSVGRASLAGVGRA